MTANPEGDGSAVVAATPHGMEAPGQLGTAAEPEAPVAGVQVGRLFNIPLYIEPGWLLLAGVLMTYVVQPTVPPQVTGLPSYLLALSFAVLLYVSVLVHELSHAVTALRLGLRVRRISLQLLGGVTDVQDEAPSPRAEFAVAFAGPALSFVLFAGAYGLSLGLPEESVAWWLAQAVWGANLVVGIFNLLPGLPLDGGRVLQAAVWRATGSRFRGTIIAAWCGRALAVLVLLTVPLALRRDGFLITVASTVLIAAFLWLGAGSSLRAARFRAKLPQLQARILLRRAVSVGPTTTVESALRRAILGRALGIVVLNSQGSPAGLVPEAAARAMPEGRRRVVPVVDLMRRIEPGLVLPADLIGEPLLAALQATPATEYLLVEADGSVAGVLLTEDVESASAGW